MRKISLIKSISLTIFLMVAFSMSIFAKGWTTDGYDWHYIDYNDVMVTEAIQPSGDEKYFLDGNGNMVRDYLLEGYNDAVYYFDDSGKMVRNTWVAVDPTQVENAMDNPPTIYLYYFGANGKAYKSNSGVVRKTIDGKKYLFNENGQMMSGWISDSGERYNEYDTDEDPFVGYVYYAGDETDGVLREGWVAYEDGSVEDRYYLKQVLWFYFIPNNNKKVYYNGSNEGNELKKRTINGKTYAFDENGVMVQGWDSDMMENPESQDSKNYFSEKEQDKGRMYKKEWIFAIPSESQDVDDHNQEVERWFYSVGSGDVVKGQLKKINQDYYVFNDKGIMQKGLCIINKYTKEYVDSIDIEKTDGRDFIISRHYVSADRIKYQTEEYSLFDDKNCIIYYFAEDEASSDFGKRNINDVTVAFGDNDYTFSSNSRGEIEGKKKNKYFQAGIQLKADPVLGLGLVFLGYSSDSMASAADFPPEYNASTHVFAQKDVNHNDIKSDYIVIKDPRDYIPKGAYPVYAVVDSKGNKVKSSNTVRKDKSGNYWMIGVNGTLGKVFEVPIRYLRSKKVWQYKSEITVNGKSRTTWIDFGVQDCYGKKCEKSRSVVGDYELYLDETYCTNCRFADVVE